MTELVITQYTQGQVSDAMVHVHPADNGMLMRDGSCFACVLASEVVRLRRAVQTLLGTLSVGEREAVTAALELRHQHNPDTNAR